MKINTHSSAFTLIEILIAATVFVVVAMLGTATMTSIVSSQVVNQQSQSVVSQVNRALGMMKEDIEHATRGSTSAPNIYVISTKLNTFSYNKPLTQANNSFPKDYALVILNAATQQADGSWATNLNTSQTIVYCADTIVQSQTNLTVMGKQLYRFVITGASGISYNQNSNFNSNNAFTCPEFDQDGSMIDSTNKFESIFNSSNLTITPTQLTDVTVGINNLDIQAVWPSGSSSPSLIDPPAINVQVAAEYNSLINNSQRASQTINQVVLGFFATPAPTVQGVYTIYNTISN
jgi:type II secretory pathway pseudopilin PulG